MFHDFCQSVTLVFCQRTHVSHDHHPRGPCCSRARISYDEPYRGAISYQKIFASALTSQGSQHPSDQLTADTACTEKRHARGALLCLPDSNGIYPPQETASDPAPELIGY